MHHLCKAGIRLIIINNMIIQIYWRRNLAITEDALENIKTRLDL